MQANFLLFLISKHPFKTYPNPSNTSKLETIDAFEAQMPIF